MDKISTERAELLLAGAKVDAQMQNSPRYKREAEEQVLILTELLASRSGVGGDVTVRPGDTVRILRARNAAGLDLYDTDLRMKRLKRGETFIVGEVTSSAPYPCPIVFPVGETSDFWRADDLELLPTLRSQPEPAGVRVKGLEWVPLAEYGPDAERASGILAGLYGVFLDEDSAAGAIFAEWAETSDALCTTAAKSLGRFASWAEAKAAAQADYEQRILAALSAPQQQKGEAASQPVTDEMVKRAAFEFLMHKGERPYRVTRRGAELWEDYAPAMRSALTAALQPQGE